MLIVDRIVTTDLHVRYIALACTLSFGLMYIERSAYRSWLSQAREHGRFARSIVVIGTDDEAARLLDLFNTHRDIGISVAGVIGDPIQAAKLNLTDSWLGSLDKAESLVEFLGVSGVIVSPSRQASPASTPADSAPCRSLTSHCSTSRPPPSLGRKWWPNAASMSSAHRWLSSCSARSLRLSPW